MRVKRFTNRDAGAKSKPLSDEYRAELEAKIRAERPSAGRVVIGLRQEGVYAEVWDADDKLAEIVGVPE